MDRGSILRANSHFLFGTFTLGEGGEVLGALTAATKSTRFGDKMTKQAEFHLRLLSQSNKKEVWGTVDTVVNCNTDSALAVN